ncbi:MAG: cobalamin B12-binding domain-containing protein [Planctomycetota bacterium]|jgi:methanogenic corrinoid protein MtbC1
MIKEQIFKRYLEALLTGDRSKARRVIEETLQRGTTAMSVYVDVIWPMMVEIEQLHRDGRISPVQEHLATRINRSIVDQLQNKLPRKPVKNQRIIVCCAPEELQELGAQMIADLFESNGWEVRYVGGGLTNDDILAYVNECGPDILLIYGTAPQQAPMIRRLIDTVKGVNAWPEMRIMLSGGLYNRAEGLWEEMGADLFADTALTAVQAAETGESVGKKEGREINKRAKRKKLKEAVA